MTHRYRLVCRRTLFAILGVLMLLVVMHSVWNYPTYRRQISEGHQILEAVYAFRSARGTYPETLVELVPDYFPDASQSILRRWQYGHIEGKDIQLMHPAPKQPHVIYRDDSNGCGWRVCNDLFILPVPQPRARPDDLPEWRKKT